MRGPERGVPGDLDSTAGPYAAPANVLAYPARAARLQRLPSTCHLDSPPLQLLLGTDLPPGTMRENADAGLHTVSLGASGNSVPGAGLACSWQATNIDMWCPRPLLSCSRTVQRDGWGQMTGLRARGRCTASGRASASPFLVLFMRPGAAGEEGATVATDSCWLVGWQRLRRLRRLRTRIRLTQSRPSYGATACARRGSAT